MMIINHLKTVRIFTALFFYTIIACIRATSRSYFGTPTRSWFDKVIHKWINQLLDEVKVDYKVINPHQVEPKPGEATILMCNHSSAYDIPLSFKAFPNHSIRMLAKKELSKIPFLGKGMKAAEFPFIDRKNRFQAIKDLAFAQELMESGIIIWIAPEGTRSKNGKLAAFKKGAFITAIHAKATIIPIGIKGAFDILPINSFKINLNQKAEIHIGKPIKAADFTLENKDELIQLTRESIKKMIEEE